MVLWGGHLVVPNWHLYRILYEFNKSNVPFKGLGGLWWNGNERPQKVSSPEMAQPARHSSMLLGRVCLSDLTLGSHRKLGGGARTLSTCF